jgi:hypothetical protein
MASLLAIDLGVKAGLALYGDDGRLRWARSHNFGSAARLRRAAATILREHHDLEVLILEGDRALAEIWCKSAQRQGILEHHLIGAETWRDLFLHARERRSGALAKDAADPLARAVIAWSGAPRPTGPLRHDAAEAILIGLWGVITRGWLTDLPEPLQLQRR